MPYTPPLPPESEEPLAYLCPDHGWCISPETHAATARRIAVVRDSAMEMNRRGIDFQLNLRAAAKRGARRRAARR